MQKRLKAWLQGTPTLTARRTERPKEDAFQRVHMLTVSQPSSAAVGCQNRQHCEWGAPALFSGSGRCASHLHCYQTVRSIRCRNHFKGHP